MLLVCPLPASEHVMSSSSSLLHTLLQDAAARSWHLQA